jgi:hypothetical protein
LVYSLMLLLVGNIIMFWASECCSLFSVKHGGMVEQLFLQYFQVSVKCQRIGL